MAKDMMEEGHREERKHGGRMKKKHGGKVAGKKPEMRADKRARGGRMTPASPLSGAGETHGGNEPEKDDRRSGGRLSAASRNALPASDFALPGRRYPLPDASHGRNALARVAQNGTAAEKAKVRAAVHRKFPGIKEG